MNKPFENSNLLSSTYINISTGTVVYLYANTAYIHFELSIFGKRDICNENLIF